MLTFGANSFVQEDPLLGGGSGTRHDQEDSLFGGDTQIEISDDADPFPETLPYSDEESKGPPHKLVLPGTLQLILFWILYRSTRNMSFEMLCKSAYNRFCIASVRCMQGASHGVHRL